MAFLDSIKSAAIKALEGIGAVKSVPFDNQTVANSPQIIFPDLNSMSAAVLGLLSPNSQPSDDPHLSSLVAAGVTWLANTLPEPDLQVKKEFLRKRAGKKRDDNVIETHALYKLMDRPNPEESGSNLWKSFAYSWIIRGNVYFIKIRNDFGQVVRLYYEPHFKVKARWVNDKQGEYITADRSESVASVPRSDSPSLKINYYEIERSQGRFRVEPDDVIHFRDGQDPWNDRYGISRLQTILRDIYGDSAVAAYAADLLGGNGVIPYVLGIDDKEGGLSQEDLQNIKTKLLAQTTGQNAGQPLVVSSRVTFNRTGLTPAELDLRASRYMAQEIFSQVTGIPSIVLNFGSGMERSIYHNMSEADRRAVTSYLQPLWWHIAQELTHQLLRDIDSDESHFVEFDLSEVGALQENENDLWTRIGQAYQDGLLKRSEARMAIDYEADPKGADDVYLVRAGSETVTLEVEQAKQEMAMEPPEPPQIQEQQPLALVKGRHTGLLKGAPDTIKQLYSAK